MTTVPVVRSGYLVDSYLTYPYLAGKADGVTGLQFNVGVIPATGLQFEVGVGEDTPEGLQFRAEIDAQNPEGLQFRTEIAAEAPAGMQFLSVQSNSTGLQFNVRIYSISNLRILRTFDSRGVDGINWTASSTAPGDFSVLNLNTDVVEQVWRSAPGFVVGVNLTCDSQLPQGVAPDTIAILGHNLTTSATVTLYGSMDPTFGTIGVAIPLEAREGSMYYIAEEFPLQTYRYWRFSIDDFTNPAGFLEIGTILFGNALVFHGENFVDDVEYAIKDFADTVRTAGHTNVSNSRALKNLLSLEFRFLKFNAPNFRAIRNMLRQDRTVYKTLWIPTPDPHDQEYTARFAVFAKLVSLPRERHRVHSRDADYVSLTVELDESL